jgi:hypothetical protein
VTLAAASAGKLQQISVNNNSSSQSVQLTVLYLWVYAGGETFLPYLAQSSHSVHTYLFSFFFLSRFIMIQIK